MTSSRFKEGLKQSFSPKIILNRLKDTYTGWSMALIGHIALGMGLGWSIIKALSSPESVVFPITALLCLALSTILAAFSVNPLFSWGSFFKNLPLFLLRLSILPICAILMLGNPYTLKLIENLQSTSSEKVLILSMIFIITLFLIFLGLLGFFAESGRKRESIAQPTLRQYLWIDIKKSLVIARAAWSGSFSALFFMALFFFPLSLLTQVLTSLMESGERLMASLPLTLQAIPFGLMWALLMVLPTIAALVARDYRSAALDKFHAKNAILTPSNQDIKPTA